MDLCACWHQGVIQVGQPGLVQGADAANVGFGSHLFLCLWGQCIIEAEQPAFMQGILEGISLLPDPQYRHLGICIRFGALPGVLGGRWERLGGSGGFFGRLMRLLESFLDAPGRSRTLWDSS